MEVTQFISNKEDRSFFDSLVENLKKCSEFKMSVAFFSWGGIQNFFPLFEELQQRNVKGQILTTTYEDFTTPEVLQKIHSFKNIELKVYVPKSEKDGFHTKGYLFQQNEQWTIIILSMRCFACTVISGKLELLEHENAAWLTKDNLMSVNWLPADVTILDKVLMLL